MLDRGFEESALEKRWSQKRLAEALQRAGLDKSRVAVARIEAQMVYVYDFQLLFIARVLGVALLELYPNIGAEDDLYDSVTELRKPRKSAAPDSAAAEGETKAAVDGFVSKQQPPLLA